MVRSKTLGALACGLLLGALAIMQLPFALPATAAAAPRPRSTSARSATEPARVLARAARGPTVYGALKSLNRSGALSAEAYGEDSATYTQALNAVKHLSGTRRAELESVIANVQQIAASGQLIASRLPAVMLTLESNTQWWSHEPLPAADQHVTVPGSHLVWEYYPGQGIEIQWLATFGEANGYYDNGHENAQLREVLEEAIPLATQRAGGIAWEYLFHFDGGAPPWTSGLSQGTALQALSRAYTRLKEPAFLTAAKQALGIFQTPPPAGVRVARPAGTLYAEYTYAPTDRILNGFIQALNGLYEYAKLTGDPLGRQLFETGDAEARAITPSYDTGAWSKYDQYTESNLNYHELLTEFLQSLCQRTSQGEPALGGLQSPTDHQTGDHLPRPRPRSPASTHLRGCHRLRRAATSLRGRHRLGRDGQPAAHANPRRSDLLHHRPALHRRPAHPAGDRAADAQAARGGARRRAAVALEGRHRQPHDPPGRARGGDQQRARRRRQAAAAVGHAEEARRVLGEHHRRGPRRQHREHERHDHARRTTHPTIVGDHSMLGAWIRFRSHASRSRAWLRWSVSVRLGGRCSSPSEEFPSPRSSPRPRPTLRRTRSALCGAPRKSLTTS